MLYFASATYHSWRTNGSILISSSSEVITRQVPSTLTLNRPRVTLRSSTWASCQWSPVVHCDERAIVNATSLSASVCSDGLFDVSFVGRWLLVKFNVARSRKERDCWSFVVVRGILMWRDVLPTNNKHQQKRPKHGDFQWTNNTGCEGESSYHRW